MTRLDPRTGGASFAGAGRRLGLAALAALATTIGCGDQADVGRSVDTTAAESSASDADATEPAAEVAVDAREGVSADGNYVVRWSPIGPGLADSEPFSIAIEVRRKDDGALADDVRVMVDAEMPHHGHGMNLVPTVRRGSRAGSFIADGLLLHMSGRWTFAIDVDEHGIAERTQWVLDVE